MKEDTQADAPYIHPAILARTRAEQEAGRARLAEIQAGAPPVENAPVTPQMELFSDDAASLPLTDEQIAAAEEAFRRDASAAVKDYISGMVVDAPTPVEPAPAPAKSKKAAAAPPAAPVPAAASDDLAELI